MNILVGVNPDEAGDDALALAAILARLTGARLVLTHIHPPPFEYPSLGPIDAEWSEFIAGRAVAAVDRARSILAQDWNIHDIVTTTEAHPSRGRGLIKAESAWDARIVVLGPAPGGDKGHISMGSVADRLLHGSSAAVALAPEGYRDTAPEHLQRIIVGFREGEESELALRTARQLATGQDLGVELLTLVLRPTRIMGARTRRNAEQAFVDAMSRRAEEQQAACLAAIGESDIPTSVISGDTTDRALSRFPWTDSDLLCLASSTEGPLHRVVLGDMTHKILRASDVPAIVLPRRFELRGGESAA